MDISDISPDIEQEPQAEQIQFQGMSFDTSILSQDEAEFGGKQWRIKSLLPIEGKNVLMKYVRPCLGAFEGLSFFEKPNGEGIAAPRPREAVFFELLGKFPSEKLDALSQIFMAKCIEYRDENGRWIPASYDPGKAFMGLDPAELILLDAMAFFKNFRESVSVIERHLMGGPAGTDK